jgi:hypothetical protein
MMFYPYFVPGLLLQIVVGVILLVVPFFIQA